MTDSHSGEETDAREQVGNTAIVSCGTRSHSEGPAKKLGHPLPPADSRLQNSSSADPLAENRQPRP